MSAEPEEQGKNIRLEDDSHDESKPELSTSLGADTDGEEEEEEGEEDEPKLKYTKLTSSLGSVYRNGDATSSFVVAGDKMHVLSVPTFQSLRLYHAHSASITSISVSPVPPPPVVGREPVYRNVSDAATPVREPSFNSATPVSPRAPRQQPLVPSTLSNSIYIATASIDGHVCVSSLVDPNDVTLRNFARPVQAIALSPEYKSERAYLSGGLAGDLILTVGGKAGVSSNANTNSATAAASGWLGSIGLGSNTGKDTVLHSGEGSISTIKWSATGKYVAWINEEGIKIMRANVKLESADAESAWKRIGHVERPRRGAWNDMAGVWKGQLDWVEDGKLEADEEDSTFTNGSTAAPETKARDNSAKGSLQIKKKRVEKLVAGWGDTAWVLHIHPGGAGVGKHVGERSVGSAEIVHKLQFHDCVVSGLSLYTPSLLAVLAYRTHDDEDKPIPSAIQPTQRRGMHHRQNGLQPEIRLIHVSTSEEVDVDTLTFSRFETLTAADYHLSTLYIPQQQLVTPVQKGAFEALGGGIWDARINATRIFSSGTSVLSGPSSGENGRASISSPPVSTGSAGKAPASGKRGVEAPPAASSAGLKIFVQSPYDCVLAVKRDLSDHLNWLLHHKQYSRAWELIDEHPTVVASGGDRHSFDSLPSTPSKAQGSLADFFADDSASQTTASASRANNSASAKEKRRIGDLWLQQLVSNNDWAAAGKVAGKVLGTSSRWEYWVWTFAHADHFDEITPYIPTTQLTPPLPSTVYELVLGHYVITDPLRLKELLEQWDPALFDVDSVVSAIEGKLHSGDVGEDTTEGGEQGRDWRMLLDSLAKLYLADNRSKEALRCYIRLRNADAAMSLIRDYRLLDAVSDDIPGLLTLRVSKEQMRSASLAELEDATTEAVRLLVDAAHQGIVRPETVVTQLERQGPSFQPFLFFYLRSLWKGQGIEESVAGRGYDRKVAEGQALVEGFADLAVSLFAEYDRPLLLPFLRVSTDYSFEKAAQICETRDYVPELVYILSKTGQTKRALFLIIGELGDVSQAISFTKENPDLWDDLLDYSMDKPRFIRGLLEEI
ncbi:Vacuolar protein sorting-associated protein 41, partial [Elasticomyces elasticus]